MEEEEYPPFRGNVAAGFPSPAEQYVESPLDMNKLLVKRPAATFFVRASGESMCGVCIQDGDILVVDRSLTPRDGDVVIARVDGAFTVKFLRNTENGPVLEAANPKFKPIHFTEGMDLQVDGVVRSVIHQFYPGE